MQLLHNGLLLLRTRAGLADSDVSITVLDQLATEEHVGEDAGGIGPVLVVRFEQADLCLKLEDLLRLLVLG